MTDIVERLRDQAMRRAGGVKMDAPHLKMLEWEAAAEIVRLRAASEWRDISTAPVISIKPMKLSDGRTDYFVAITVGDREITPYKLREEWQAQYEADSFRWLLLGAEKPDMMAYGPAYVDDQSTQIPAPPQRNEVTK